MSEEMLKEQAVERADAALDAAGITPNLPIDERIKELVQQRDTAKADREAILDTRRADQDQAKSELRQIKQDLMAMGRLEKLACELVMGDASPDDIGGTD